MSGDHSRVMSPPREQVGELTGVVVPVGVIKHLAVELNSLRHFDLGKLGAHLETISGKQKQFKLSGIFSVPYHSQLGEKDGISGSQ